MDTQIDPRKRRKASKVVEVQEPYGQESGNAAMQDEGRPKPNGPGARREPQDQESDPDSQEAGPGELDEEVE